MEFSLLVLAAEAWTRVFLILLAITHGLVLVLLLLFRRSLGLITLPHPTSLIRRTLLLLLRHLHLSLAFRQPVSRVVVVFIFLFDVLRFKFHRC